MKFKSFMNEIAGVGESPEAAAVGGLGRGKLGGALANRIAGQTQREPGEEERQPILPIMTIQAGKIDARISVVGYEKAYENMLRACNQILSDEQAMVQVTPEDAQDLSGGGETGVSGKNGKLVPWEQVYFPSARNRPQRGYIELEYFRHATKGLLGRTLWSAGWMAKRPFSAPFRLAGEKMLGVALNPEQFYKAQFIKELQRLANQQILYGLDEWDVDTTYAGRNIIIKPKKGMHENHNPYMGRE